MERLLFEMSKEGKSAYSIPPLDVDDIEVEKVIPKNILRSKKIGLPSLSEVDISRHYTRLSRMNYGVDVGIYPLGSCTMKY
ncbi:MAG TPA: aminomethyl-transferring glycine dehydrogenase subunit GcvPB, partial [Firmicutes bacterium]|nr:aminomethyl-transferring glycine dehydrogenase subunit GcvPB [Bacillota bacterium]